MGDRQWGNLDEPVQPCQAALERSCRSRTLNYEIPHETIFVVYLDRKIQEVKDESTIKVRKTNEKIVTVVRTLRDKNVLSEASYFKKYCGTILLLSRMVN